MAEEEKPAEGEAASDAADAVQKKGGDAAAPAGGGSQKLVLGVLALNVVVLLALGVLVFLNSKKAGTTTGLDQVREAPGEHAGKDAHSGGGSEQGGGDKKEATPSLFIKESFTVNLADPGGANFAKVDIDIEVPDDFVKVEVESIRPKIRDFIIVMLSSKTYAQVDSGDGRDFLREEIRNKINGFLKRGQITNVYFTQFIIQ